MILQKVARRAPSNYYRPPGHPKGRHEGEDTGWRILDPKGYDVYAAAPGTVVEVYHLGGFNQGWGNRVVINHAPGVNTTYNHFRNGTVTVRPGDKVAAGQLLGKMGSTGLATGDHVHFELEIGGRGPEFRVDPRPYFSVHLPGTEPKPIPAPGPAGGGSSPITIPPPASGTLRGDDVFVISNNIPGHKQKGTAWIAVPQGNGKPRATVLFHGDTFPGVPVIQFVNRASWDKFTAGIQWA